MSAIEVHDPLGAEPADRSIFRRLFILSLVIHAFIVLATMWTSPFGEERAAGGADEIIPLDGISVEIVDSLPGDGATIPAPLSIGTLLDADTLAQNPTEVATEPTMRRIAEVETTIVTEESLTTAKAADAPSTEPVAPEPVSPVGGAAATTSAPDSQAQLEIDTPSFPVTAEFVAPTRALTIELVIEASEAETAPPASIASDITPAEAIPSPPINASPAGPTATAETIASGFAAPAAAAIETTSVEDNDATVAETASADAEAPVSPRVDAVSAASSTPTETVTTAASSETVPVEKTPEAAAASNADRQEAIAAAAPQATPTRLPLTEALPALAEARPSVDKSEVDAPIVPAQTANAAAQAPAAPVDAPVAQSQSQTKPVAVATPPEVEAMSAVPVASASPKPVEQTSAMTVAAPTAIILTPQSAAPDFRAEAVEPSRDVGAAARTAAAVPDDDAPAASPVAAAENEPPPSTATASPERTADLAPPETSSTTAEADPSLQPDPLNLVAAPIPRPRPTVVQASAASAEKRKPAAPPAQVARKVQKPVPTATAAAPAAPPAPFLGGIIAPASAEQKAARGPTAGSSGAGGTNRDAQGRASVSTYQATLFAQLRRFRSYPAEARRQGIKGTATVTFTVNANGALVGVALTGSSGAPILDREAVAMVRRASPFPPIPVGLGRSQMTVRAPICFDIR